MELAVRNAVYIYISIFEACVDLFWDTLALDSLAFSQDDVIDQGPYK